MALTTKETSGTGRPRTDAYVSDRRLYLDKDGKVVEADSPDRVTLLVGKNGSITRATAVEHGLATEGEPVTPAHQDKPNPAPTVAPAAPKPEAPKPAPPAKPGG